LITKILSWKSANSFDDDLQMNLFYSPHHLAFFSKVNEKEFQTLYVFKRNSSELLYPELIHECKETINNELNININLAKIFISDTPYTVIPEQLFDKNKIEDFLSSTRKKQFDEISKSNSIIGLKINFLYDLPKSIDEYCLQHDIELKLWLIPFISNFLENDNNINGISAIFIDKTITIIAHNNGKLLFSNDFNYQESLDALYYIMLVYNELHFNPEQIVLTVFGHISAESDIANQLKRYIAEVKFSNQDNLVEPALNYYSYLLKL